MITFINAFCLLLAIGAVTTIRNEAKYEHTGAFYEAARVTEIASGSDVVTRWAVGGGADFKVKRVADKTITPPSRRNNESYFMKHVWKYIGADK